jgi:alpha-D-glucose phosphate-specific phosphoglucomutase
VAVGNTPIKFGTSGWRAVIADQFTFANVRLATAAIAEHVLSRVKHPTLIVGYDTRFLSEAFAAEAASVLRTHGVRVLLCDSFTPTPTIAYEILRRKTDGAINFTASHNPAEYHGLKFCAADGGPALPGQTRDIEARAARIGTPPASEAQGPQLEGVERISCREPFLARLRELVRFPVLREAKLTLVCDALHGCGAGYLDRVLAEEGVRAVSIRSERDVLFDGTGPDVSETNLQPLAERVRQEGARLGLATDGDADRFGIIDADGSCVSPNHVLGMLYDYLVESRGWRLGVARSVATSHLLDAVARAQGLPVYETPVGFKYIGEFIKQDKIALGGEESAGLSIRGHVPEKDGILACLLVAEMTAARGATLREQLQTLFRKVGAEYWPLRENLHLEAAVQARTIERLKSDMKEFDGRPVVKTDRTDGLKMMFGDRSWILMRASGTEPVLRVYTEASTPEAARRLVAGAVKWISA